MADYLEGHVKRDPVTGSVAVRTNQPETSPADSFAIVQAWLVATTYSGAHFASTDVVAGWDDMYVPEPPPETSSPTVVAPV